MPMVDIPIGFDFYQSYSRRFSGQRCINWIPVASESGSIKDRMLMQPSGIKLFSDTGLPPNRGAILVNEIPYFVNGEKLYSINIVGDSVNLGNIPGNEPLSIATNGNFIVFLIPGKKAYVYDISNSSVSEITSANFNVSSFVVFKDGYFVFSSYDRKKYFNSSLNDPFTYDALDFGDADILPDGINSLHVNHNELFVIGSETIKVVQNVGGEGFPFQVIPGAYIQKGCISPFSVIDFDNTFCFLGGGKGELPAVWKVTGSSSAVKISNDAIDFKIQQYNKDEISKCRAMSYSERGQFILIFTIKSERIPGITLFYNATASSILGYSVWGELRTGVKEGHFDVFSIVKAYGKILTAHDSTGKIGQLDKLTFDFLGSSIYRNCVTSPFESKGKSFFSSDIELVFDSGVGNEKGLSPQVRLSFSDDGGNTFKYETSRSIGKVGNYKKRAIWYRQGRIPNTRSISITITDRVMANLIGIRANLEAGI